MFAGIFIGVFVALVVCFGLYLADVERLRVYAIAIAVCVIACGFWGASMDNYELREDISGFTAIKETYEMAVKSESLSDLENLQIVNTAIDQNKELARRKASINAWWNIAISKSLKDQLNNLTPIDVG